MKSYKSPQDFIQAFPDWEGALEKLRSLILTTELEETMKWGAPVYTIDYKNIVGLGAFKSYFGVPFFQGAFLKDHNKVLINAQEGKTKAQRQWRFSNIEEIDEKLPEIGFKLQNVDENWTLKEMKEEVIKIFKDTKVNGSKFAADLLSDISFLYPAVL